MTNNTNGIDTLLEIDRELTEIFNHIKADQKETSKAYSKSLRRARLYIDNWPEDFDLTPIKQ